MAEKEQNPPPATPPAKSNTALVDEIGTLTYPRAVQRFGKDRAIEVMQKVAELGGHGHFVEDELKSPLFGGLGMPPADIGKPPAKEDFAHLPDPDFWLGEATEKYEIAKARSVTDRAAINEYYASLR